LVPGAPLFLPFRFTLDRGTATLPVRQPANRKGGNDKQQFPWRQFPEAILDWHFAMIEVK
jgi:hypothetical protein